MTQDDTIRIAELLAGRALGDLDHVEADELDALLAGDPSLETDEFDRTAAAVATLSLPSAGLPEALRSRILYEAPEYIPSANPPASVNIHVESPSPSTTIDSPFTSRLREAAGWALAASLLFAMAYSGFFGSTQGPTAAEARLALLEQTDVINLDWAPGLHPFSGKVTGDVVWSNKDQTGYMRFEGMPINDPQKEQYQLWIVDPQRDPNPIDGGVFNVTETGEVIVPIEAKLNVISPEMFAITVEKPGGVVVSAQDNLPLLAKVEE